MATRIIPKIDNSSTNPVIGTEDKGTGSDEYNQLGKLHDAFFEASNTEYTGIDDNQQLNIVQGLFDNVNNNATNITNIENDITVLEQNVNNAVGSIENKMDKVGGGIVDGIAIFDNLGQVQNSGLTFDDISGGGSVVEQYKTRHEIVVVDDRMTTDIDPNEGKRLYGSLQGGELFEQKNIFNSFVLKVRDEEHFINYQNCPYSGLNLPLEGTKGLIELYNVIGDNHWADFSKDFSNFNNGMNVNGSAEKMPAIATLFLVKGSPNNNSITLNLNFNSFLVTNTGFYIKNPANSQLIDMFNINTVPELYSNLSPTPDNVVRNWKTILKNKSDYLFFSPTQNINNVVPIESYSSKYLTSEIGITSFNEIIKSLLQENEALIDLWQDLDINPITEGKPRYRIVSTYEYIDGRLNYYINHLAIAKNGWMVNCYAKCKSFNNAILPLKSGYFKIYDLQFIVKDTENTIFADQEGTITYNDMLNNSEYDQVIEKITHLKNTFSFAFALLPPEYEIIAPIGYAIVNKISENSLPFRACGDVKNNTFTVRPASHRLSSIINQNNTLYTQIFTATGNNTINQATKFASFYNFGKTCFTSSRPIAITQGSTVINLSALTVTERLLLAILLLNSVPTALTQTITLPIGNDFMCQYYDQQGNKYLPDNTKIISVNFTATNLNNLETWRINSITLNKPVNLASTQGVMAFFNYKTLFYNRTRNTSSGNMNLSVEMVGITEITNYNYRRLTVPQGSYYIAMDNRSNKNRPLYSIPFSRIVFLTDAFPALDSNQIIKSASKEPVFMYSDIPTPNGSTTIATFATIGAEFDTINH